MPTIEVPKEKWSGAVREITLGATAADGGTRAKTVTVGGETTLPFLHFEGEIPNPPLLPSKCRIESQPIGLLCCWKPGVTCQKTLLRGPKQLKMLAPTSSCSSSACTTT